MELDLDKSLKEKKLTEINKNATSNKIDLKGIYKSLRLRLPKKIKWTNVYLTLTTIFTIVAIALGLQLHDISQNPNSYGLRREITEEKPGAKYINQLLAIIGSSKAVDVRLITDINFFRQNNPEIGEFILNADNGDALIIFTELELAVIVRPSTNKIINLSKIRIKT
jgi:hypothetical protein